RPALSRRHAQGRVQTLGIEVVGVRNEDIGLGSQVIGLGPDTEMILPPGSYVELLIEPGIQRRIANQGRCKSGVRGRLIQADARIAIAEPGGSSRLESGIL